MSSRVVLPATAARPLPVPAAEAVDMLPATDRQLAEALMVVHGAVGVGPAAPKDRPAFVQRVREIALVMAGAGWTVAQVRTAAQMLASSPELDDKIRYGRPITAADFERVRRQGLQTRTLRESLDDGAGEVEVERVITTRTGFALRIAAGKLYTAREALEIWRAAGEPGVFADGVPLANDPETLSDHPTAMFRAVEVPEVIRGAHREGPCRRFRLKS